MVFAQPGRTYVCQPDAVDNMIGLNLCMGGQVVRVVEVLSHSAMIETLDGIALGAVTEDALYKIPKDYQFDCESGFPQHLVS